MQIGTLVRRINTAVREHETAVARRLCADAEGEMSRCEGVALHHLQAAVEKASEWLSTQDRLRRVLFNRLEEAERNNDALVARSLMGQVNAVLAHDDPPSKAEAGIVAAVRGLKPPRRPQPARPIQSRTKPAPGTSTPREERRARRIALAEARSLLGRLDAKCLPAAKEQRLIRDLARVTETAGEWLSVRERGDVERWISKLAAQQRQQDADDTAKPAPCAPVSSSVPEASDRLGQPRLSPDVHASAAAAVRGALKKAAREQTTTSWARLGHQLGSALPPMGNADRVQVLILVDQATPPNEPLLCSLLAAGDLEVRKDYRSVAAALSLEAPIDDEDLRDVVEADVQQVFDTWHNR
ncbi:hypothetical protein AS594_35975 [Streptomyces agglomeratus]|uniref:Uncharacterized protein n=1 Tax=Streptomyces agglomeratus TaxID=285458 RepID=A0A1E5PHN2_9ACTN|nr:hypothetical protein AS594_35975 [Streptomyces agglomeratus]